MAASATLGMKVLSTQIWSTSSPASTADLGVEEIGVLRGGVVAPNGHVRDITDVDLKLATAGLARLWSRRVRALKRSLGMSGALLIAIRAFVLAEVTGHQDADVVSGRLVERLAQAVKIAPLALSRSLRSMPALRGMAPTLSTLAPSKTFLGSSPMTILVRFGNAQSSAP